MAASKYISTPRWYHRVIRSISRPFASTVGKWTWRMGRPTRLTDSNIDKLKESLLPGMTILTTTKYQASNWFIKGKYKHTATYVGGGMIVQATGDGVTLDRLEDLLYVVDKVAVLKPKFATDSQMQDAANRAVELVGRPYDYDFDFNPGRNRFYYCAEIQWGTWLSLLGSVPFEPELILGEYTLLPNSFYTSGNWSVEFEIDE